MNTRESNEIRELKADELDKEVSELQDSELNKVTGGVTITKRLDISSPKLFLDAVPGALKL
jgi:bacteriocin-like protein